LWSNLVNLFQKREVLKDHVQITAFFKDLFPPQWEGALHELSYHLLVSVGFVEFG